jgi:hypothetical protein
VRRVLGAWATFGKRLGITAQSVPSHMALNFWTGMLKIVEWKPLGAT